MSEQLTVPRPDQTKFTPAITLDSIQPRPDSAKTVKYMERMHAAETLSTPTQAKEFLDSLTYDDFKKWISFVNGVERGIPATERGQVSDSYIAHDSALFGTETDYQPPHKQHRDDLLQVAFKKAQSIDDPEIAGLTLGLALNAIHYFEDGNGRTGRITYSLLSKGYNGSPEDQQYYSALLENTKGREVIDLSPTISNIDSKVRLELRAKVQEQSGYLDAFDGDPPIAIDDPYPDVMVEKTPDSLAVSEDIDEKGREMLYQTLGVPSMAIISLMLTFKPERVRDFVREGRFGGGYEIAGDKFLPTLTQEEITEWWRNSQVVLASYVRRLIDVSDRDDIEEIAARYRKQAKE